jgi:predicted dehydrogenase
MKRFKKPILIVGYGSVGRRHLRNLRALGQKNFVLYRTGESVLPDDEIAGIPAEYDLNKAFSYEPVAAIIANPTAFHMGVALAAGRAGAHLFIEKPISDSLDGVEELRRLVTGKGLIVQVGFQFRFHPPFLRIKRRLEKNEIGKIVSVQACWGEYLPSWHPWEDYRQSYASRKKLGGGVLLTLCHPFDYLRWFFGDVSGVLAQESHGGGLEIDVEDTADVLLNFKSGAVGNVHVDYLQRPAELYIRIIGQKGIIHWSNSESKVDRNTMFVSEMRHFLSCVREGKQPLCTLSDGIEALRIVLAAKQSIREKRLIELK